MIPASYPARQRNRRLARGLKDAVLALAILLLAGASAGTRIPALAPALLLLSLVIAARCVRSLRLARRSSIGARSEQRVRAQLEALEHEGWRVEHSLRWRGGGDIDHVAIAPGHVRMAFAIETKTRTYTPGDLARIAAIAQWLSGRRPSWCRRGAVAVLCLAGTGGVERWEGGVAVVSSERLAELLRRLAGTTPKPRFLRG